jgi:EpsI family protein
MSPFSIRVLIVALMVAAAGLSYVMKPTEMLAQTRGGQDLSALIPQKFGDWQNDPSIIPIDVAPDVQAKLDKIYSQTLARTYVNKAGSRVMLSVAYGGDQSDSLQLHKPEACYPAQGFSISRSYNDRLVTDHGTLPLRRLITHLGARHEPVSYWVVVGDHPVVGTIELKLAQMRYGLTGRVPDGMIVRVSTISPDENRAFDIQNKFVIDLLQAADNAGRKRLIGGA